MFLYKKMYLHLFNQVSDALTELEQGKTGNARRILKKAQQETEEIYIGANLKERLLRKNSRWQ